MNFTLDISDDLVKRIHQEADRKGIDATAVVHSVLARHLSEGPSDDLGKLDEAELLRVIGAGLSAHEWSRYERLVAGRKNESISPDDLQTLVQLTDRLEAIGARRIEALACLARRRKVSVESLMSELEIQPRSVA